MKQSTISVSFDAEKITATKRYMSRKDGDLEAELAASLERLYEKHVPASVRDYIEDNNAEEGEAAPTRRSVKEAQA